MQKLCMPFLRKFRGTGNHSIDRDRVLFTLSLKAKGHLCDMTSGRAKAKKKNLRARLLCVCVHIEFHHQRVLCSLLICSCRFFFSLIRLLDYDFGCSKTRAGSNHLYFFFFCVRFHLFHGLNEMEE